MIYPMQVLHEIKTKADTRLPEYKGDHVRIFTHPPTKLLPNGFLMSLSAREEHGYKRRGTLYRGCTDIGVFDPSLDDDTLLRQIEEARSLFPNAGIASA